MVRSPSEDETSTPPEPFLSRLPGTTANGVNANREIFDIVPRPNAESNATSTTTATRLNSLLYKLRMFSLHLFSVVGVLASLSVLAGKTDFRWSLAEEHGHHSSRDISPQRVSGNSSASLEAHDDDGPGAAVGAPLSHEEVNETHVEVHRSFTLDRGLTFRQYSAPFRCKTVARQMPPALRLCWSKRPLF